MPNGLMTTFRSDDRELTKEEWIVEYAQLSKTERELVRTMVQDNLFIYSCALDGAWLVSTTGERIKKLHDSNVTKLYDQYIIENTTPRQTKKGPQNKFGKSKTYSVAMFRVIATLPEQVYQD